MNTAHQTNPFIGAWELVSGSYIDDQGIVTDYEAAEMKALKVLAAHTFSFISTAKGVFYAAGGGDYSVAEGTYQETPALASHESMLSQTYTFQYQLENEIWTNSRWKDGVRVEFEVWKRLP